MMRSTPRFVAATVAAAGLLTGSLLAATAAPASAYTCGNTSPPTQCADASFGTITIGETLTISLSSSSFPAFTAVPGQTYIYLDSPPTGITANGPGTTVTLSTNDPAGSDLDVYALQDFSQPGLSLTGTPFYIYANEIQGWRAFGASGAGAAQIITQQGPGTISVPTGFKVTIPAGLAPGTYSGAVAEFVAFAN